MNMTKTSPLKTWTKTTSQESIFLGGEADDWFNRNAQKLSQPVSKDDIPLRLIREARLRPKRVLEVGASNGRRLAALRERIKCDCVAVEPAKAALRDGRRRFPGVRFLHGTADHLPAEVLRRPFDLVIVHAVFHWVSRERLMTALAQVDRVVAPGGHLLIGDFYPKTPEKIAYHHLPGSDVWTYKLDYPAVFLATGLYKEKARVIEHYPNPPAPGASSSGLIALLQKTSMYKPFIPKHA